MFFNVDSNYFTHEKICELTDREKICHLKLINEARKRKNSVITQFNSRKFLVKLWGTDPRITVKTWEKFVRIGLIDSKNGEFLLHDFWDYQRLSSTERSQKSRMGNATNCNKSCAADATNLQQNATPRLDKIREDKSSRNEFSAENSESHFSKKRTKQASENAQDVSRHLADKIRAQYPDTILGTESHKKCMLAAHHLDSLLKKVSEDEIRSVIDFAFSDDFWRDKVQSVKGFIKKFDTLQAKSKMGGDGRPIQKILPMKTMKEIWIEDHPGKDYPYDSAAVAR